MTKLVTAVLCATGTAFLLWGQRVHLDTKESEADAVTNIVTAPAELRARTIFQEIALAEERAMQAALLVAPLPDGSNWPFAPNLSLKGAAKRTNVLKARRKEELTTIANLHDMTIECLKMLYGRGETLGWPRR